MLLIAFNTPRQRESLYPVQDMVDFRLKIHTNLDRGKLISLQEFKDILIYFSEKDASFRFSINDLKTLLNFVISSQLYRKNSVHLASSLLRITNQFDTNQEMLL